MTEEVLTAREAGRRSRAAVHAQGCGTLAALRAFWEFDALELVEISG
jgi:hypothetical protein